MNIPLESVESSFIDAMGYDPETETCRVRYRDGKEFDYRLTQAEYDRWRNAPSVGKYFHQHVKKQFTARPA